MFSLPSLPTDNLYKFVFLAGLVLLIYSFYVQEHHQDELTNTNKSLDSLKTTVAEQTRENSVVTQRKVKTVNDLITTVNENIKDLERLTKSHQTHTKKFKILYEELENRQAALLTTQHSLDSTSTILGRASVDFEIEATKLITKQVYGELRAKQHEIYFWIGLATFILGALSWLLVVQLPQDELNRIQLKIARLELAKQTGPQENTN